MVQTAVQCAVVGYVGCANTYHSLVAIRRLNNDNRLGVVSGERFLLSPGLRVFGMAVTVLAVSMHGVRALQQLVQRRSRPGGLRYAQSRGEVAQLLLRTARPDHGLLGARHGAGEAVSRHALRPELSEPLHQAVGRVARYCDRSLLLLLMVLVGLRGRISRAAERVTVRSRSRRRLTLLALLAAAVSRLRAAATWICVRNVSVLVEIGGVWTGDARAADPLVRVRAGHAAVAAAILTHLCYAEILVFS